MTKDKLYKYIGYNGVITSPILLPTIEHLTVYQLNAKDGYHLTDGVVKQYRVLVAEDEVDKWKEVKGAID